jgi:hypothetical protein
MKIRTRIAAAVFTAVTLAAVGATTASAALVGDSSPLKAPLCVTSTKQCGWVLGGSN